MAIFDIFSLISNICTIAAFGVALYVWLTWKVQHNYSFVRDKLFEVELAAYDYFEALEGYCNIRYRMKIDQLSNLVSAFNVEMEKKSYEVYSLAKKTLESEIKKLYVLNIELPINIKLIYEKLESIIQGTLEELEHPLMLIDSVEAIKNDALLELRQERIKVMKSLEEKRKGL